MIKELVTLALLLVVNHALLLVVRKLLEDFRPSYTLESAHWKSPGSISIKLWKCVDVDLEGFLFVTTSSIILNLIRARIQKKEKSSRLARFCWHFIQFCNVDWVAELAFKDGWLKLVTNCQVVKLWPLLSKQVSVSLVGAEWGECRCRKVAFLVWNQLHWMEGQLLWDTFTSVVFNLTKYLESTARNYSYLDFGWHPGVCCSQGPGGRISPNWWSW